MKSTCNCIICGQCALRDYSQICWAWAEGQHTERGSFPSNNCEGIDTWPRMQTLEEFCHYISTSDSDFGFTGKRIERWEKYLEILIFTGCKFVLSHNYHRLACLVMCSHTNGMFIYYKLLVCLPLWHGHTLDISLSSLPLSMNPNTSEHT